MGEFITIKSIKSLMKGIPSFCVNGIKLSEHLGDQLKKVNIVIREDAEIDIVTISCNKNGVSIMFGECKVSNHKLIKVLQSILAIAVHRRASPSIAELKF